MAAHTLALNISCLLGVMAQGASVGAKILADAGVTLDKAQTALGAVPIPNNFTSGIMTKNLSETAPATLKMSWDVAGVPPRLPLST